MRNKSYFDDVEEAINQQKVDSTTTSRELPGDPVPTRPSGESYETVNRPRHYNQHEAGIECIDVTEWMSFNLGTAVAYIWRVDQKDSGDEDLRKAIWFLQREQERRRRIKDGTTDIRNHSANRERRSK